MSDTDPRLKELAEKILAKIDISETDPDVGFVDPLTIILVIGVILSLIRVIQECRSSQLSSMDNASQTNLVQSEIKTFSMRQGWFGQMRMNRAIKKHLNPTQYKKYGQQLKQAILDVGRDISQEETVALLGASNV